MFCILTEPLESSGSTVIVSDPRSITRPKRKPFVGSGAQTNPEMSIVFPTKIQLANWLGLDENQAQIEAGKHNFKLVFSALGRRERRMLRTPGHIILIRNSNYIENSMPPKSHHPKICRKSLGDARQ